jgi:tetratricopeptide (TPR) repeat protein
MDRSKEVLLELAQAARRNGRAKEALKHFQRVIDLDAQSSEAWYGRGEALEDLGQFRDAIEAYGRGRELDPASYSAIGLFAIGNCQVGLGDRRAALAAYDLALQEAPHLSRIWHNRGTALFELGRYEEAAASYTRALEIEPAAVKTAIWRAWCLERLGNNEAAQQPPEPRGEIATAWQEIGTHEYKRGDPERALEAFGRALALQPSLGWALAGRGACLAALGRAEEALEAFDRAMALDDDAKPVAAANRATLLRQLGNQGKAAEAYEHALAANPNSVEDQKARALALQALERHQEALQSLAIVRKLDPWNTEMAFVEGVSQEALEHYSEAAECYRRFLERTPDRAQAWFRLAGCINAQGRNQEALAAYERAQALGTDTAEIWMQKAVALAQLERYEEATHCFDRSLEREPGRDAALYNRGICRQRLGRHEAAIADFEQVLEQGQPSSYSLVAAHFKALSHEALGQSSAAQSCRIMKEAYRELAQNRFPEATALFQKALDADAGNAAASMRVGAYLIEQGMLEEAVEQMKRTGALRPRNPVLWSSLGAMLGRLDRHEEEDDCYAKAIEADPLYAPALRNRALMLVDTGRLREGLDLYTRALALEGDSANAWYGKGVALYRLSEVAEAAQSFRRAVELAPGDADAWRDLGTCLVQLKQYSEALAAWNKAAQIDPAMDLQQNLRQLQSWSDGRVHSLSMVAYAYFERGQMREAAQYFDAALEIDPRQDGLWNDRGLCAERLEGPQQALHYFSRALEIDPENPQTWYNRGLSLRNLKQHEDAVTALVKTIAIHRARNLPPDENLLHGHHNLASSLMVLGRNEDALDHFDEVLRLAREDPQRWQEEARRAGNLKRALLGAAAAGG